MKAPTHFLLEMKARVAIVTLNRPEKKNPLTFESYAELRDFFFGLSEQPEIKAVVIQGAGGNFCSGGDVHEIIGPLVTMNKTELLQFTRMTGDLVKAIRTCPQVVTGSIQGVCAGAGAAIAMACDYRVGSPDSKIAFLFTRVGLAGCDMGACALLPRIIGMGRAADLLFTGRSMTAKEAYEWGFYNQVADIPLERALDFAERMATGPTRAHAMTKEMLNRELNMSLEEALEAEAVAQARCMQTKDFKRAYEAFVEKRKPEFRGD